MKRKKLSVLGLFSGIGAFELGLQRAGMDIKAYCEIEEPCLKVLRKNFSKAVEYTNVKTVDPKGYDVMCGGFPCTDISIAGKNKGLLDGEKSSLWREYKASIETGKPKYAIIENVSGLLGRGLEIILQDLAEIGYDAAWTTFDSKYFGVPQRRRRVYIVAVRDGIPAESDFFQCGQRDPELQSHAEKILAVNQGFGWDFTQGERERQGFTFLTRQRSDEYSEIGLSGTLAKRDYKAKTDVVVGQGFVRRVAPNERLLLQGLEIDWWDGCELTDTQKYMFSGMTVPVVKHIGKCILEFDNV